MIRLYIVAKIGPIPVWEADLPRPNPNYPAIEGLYLEQDLLDFQDKVQFHTQPGGRAAHVWEAKANGPLDTKGLSSKRLLDGIRAKIRALPGTPEGHFPNGSGGLGGKAAF